MSHPLDGPRLKIRRAISEIDTLARTEEAFRSEPNYEIVRAEFNPKTGKYAYRVRVNTPPSLEWGVWIGEIAHNLRSALDGLTWQLALLTTDAPARNTQFPIFLIGRSHKKAIPQFEKGGRSMIRNLRPEHQAVIELLQPYKRSRGGKKSLLYRLSEINNADKHRLIQVVGATPGAVTWAYWGDDESRVISRPFNIIEDGAKILEATPDVHVDPKLIPLVAFWKGCAPVFRLGVHLTLQRIAEHVSEIVEGFGPEFL